MSFLEMDRARRLEASAKILHCAENGDGDDDTPCVGEVRVYRTSVGVLPLCSSHSTKVFEGEGISDDALASLGLNPALAGPTVVIRVPLADLWDTHDGKALRLRRLGAISAGCAATPCRPCDGTAPAGRCVCPCHASP